jgi:hypothetical protein
LEYIIFGIGILTQTFLLIGEIFFMKKTFLGIFLLALASMTYASNLPMSKQATLVEVFSATEISINATGLGRNERAATIDLQKAAVWFALHGGTDPLLNNEQARTNFERHQEAFFDDVSKFITFRTERMISSTKTRLPDGRNGFRITQNVRVSTGLLRAELERMGVLTARSDLAAQVGLPMIMVIPETPSNQTPLQVFEGNPLARHSAGVIESFLTARRYDVIVPRAMEQLNDLANIQSQLRGNEEDIAYQLSLSLGADVYITFTGQVDNNQARVQIRAYETTTARLLGTETGFSERRPGASGEALVEEAINGAITNVLARITEFWVEDTRRGIQYKLILNVTGNFSQRQLTDLQFAVSDAVAETFATSREVIVTDATMDYLVWTTNPAHSSSMNIFRDLRTKLSRHTDVQRININRKLIVLGLDNP